MTVELRVKGCECTSKREQHILATVAVVTVASCFIKESIQSAVVHRVVVWFSDDRTVLDTHNIHYNILLGGQREADRCARHANLTSRRQGQLSAEVILLPIALALSHEHYTRTRTAASCSGLRGLSAAFRSTQMCHPHTHSFTFTHVNIYAQLLLFTCLPDSILNYCLNLNYTNTKKATISLFYIRYFIHLSS